MPETPTTAMTYSNWGNNQGPNAKASGFFFNLFANAAENCGMIRVDDNFKWHDGICDGKISNLHYSFICQYGMFIW